MEKEKLEAILEAHKHFVYEDCEGFKKMRADLSCADLRHANLRNANLRCADLYCADMFDADLSCADLSSANLFGADLGGADLRDANLFCADLSDANLFGADLFGAKGVPYIPMVCPEEGGFFGYKKCAEDKIVKLYIPKDAKRSSSTCRKCRCSKAFVCEIVDSLGNECNCAVSHYDDHLVYKLHEFVESEFCEDRFKECAEGIYFFMQRKEAEMYAS